MWSSNQRSDEYGGPLENRVRLLREVIEETVEAVGSPARCTQNPAASLAKGRAVLACRYTGRTREIEVASVVMVTSREPTDGLYHELADQIDIERIGDCRAPGLIATAVYAGHLYAREMDEMPHEGLLFKRENVLASSDPGLRIRLRSAAV
jgi:dimethylamine/trimethylamine dehydrogenase